MMHTPKRVFFQRPHDGGVAINVDPFEVERIQTAVPHTLNAPTSPQYVCGIDDERRARGKPPVAM